VSKENETYFIHISQETIREIQQLSDSIVASKPTIQKIIVKRIPRRAVLKPSHAIYRLQNQHFALGDRVVMVRDSGVVPLSCQGTVMGINPKSLDVVWDVAFMSGETLGDR
jgi:5'-3' exoribonuclease 1